MSMTRSGEQDRKPGHRKIPIIAITVFGSGLFLALAVSIVLYLGFDQATKNIRQLWGHQAQTLVDALESSLAHQLVPIVEQAQWVVDHIDDLSDLTKLDGLVFGSLAATPQVTGIGVYRANGYGRRWHRDTRTAISEDKSSNADVIKWLNQGTQLTGNAWRAPIWLESLETVTLLHDMPLRNDTGEFLGMFSQVMPVSVLSHALSSNYVETGLTPFILYGRELVLAHPQLINEGSLLESTNEHPLPSIDQLGDAVLTRLWTPDETEPFISEELTNVNSGGVFWGDDFYLFLYREITAYGDVPWTIGVYINTTLLASDNMEQMMIAGSAGLLVLLIAILVAVYAGRRISTPIRAIAGAAKIVEAGNLDEAPELEGSRIRELDDAAVAFNTMTHRLKERDLIRRTLGRFVPEEVAGRMLAEGGEIPAQQVEATILFCDIESFTQLTESLGPVRIVEVLNTYFSSAVEILERHGGVVTQFQGDAILATFNVPIENEKHAVDAINAAIDMLNAVQVTEFSGETLNIRIGINTGPVVAGAIGAEGRLNYTVHGDAVNLAARLEALNKEFGTRLIVSEHTARLAPGFQFTPLGESLVRGQKQSLNLYTVQT